MITDNLQQVEPIQPKETDNQAIDRLSKMNTIEYERCREEEAKLLKMRVSVLDELVSSERKTIEGKEEDNILFPHVDPWENEVNLSDLLTSIIRAINCFMVLPTNNEAVAIALWIVQTYFIDVLECAPILHIKSPEPRCGKTTLSRLIFKMAYKTLLASNISPAALFRLIEQYSPTLLIDEADSFLRENEELRGIINSGHGRDAAFTIRCDGDDHAVKKFCTFGAKVISGIGSMADTIEDRSITIVLRRMLETEKKEKLSMHNRHQQKIFNDVRRMCSRFALNNIDKLKNINPDIPSKLNDRAADNWHALLSLATLAGDAWITNARETAIALAGGEQSVITIGVELLNDIQEIFEGDRYKYAEKIYSSDLLEALNQIDDAPWPTFNRGKPMTARQLAHRLKEYNIKSKDMRIHGPNKKGFERTEFEDAWERYIPSQSSSDSAATNETSRQSLSDTDFSVAGHAESVLTKEQLNQSTFATSSNVAGAKARQNENVADEKPLQAILNGTCRGVSDKTHISANVIEHKIGCKCGYVPPFCTCSIR